MKFVYHYDEVYRVCMKTKQSAGTTFVKSVNNKVTLVEFVWSLFSIPVKVSFSPKLAVFQCK